MMKYDLDGKDVINIKVADIIIEPNYEAVDFTNHRLFNNDISQDNALFDLLSSRPIVVIDNGSGKYVCIRGTRELMIMQRICSPAAKVPVVVFKAKIDGSAVDYMICYELMIALVQATANSKKTFSEAFLRLGGRLSRVLPVLAGKHAAGHYLGISKVWIRKLRAKSSLGQGGKLHEGDS